MLTLSGAVRALAQDLGIAVLVINHTVSGRDGDAGSLKPALGETWKSQRACAIALVVVSVCISALTYSASCQHTHASSSHRAHRLMACQLSDRCTTPPLLWGGVEASTCRIVLKLLV